MATPCHHDGNKLPWPTSILASTAQPRGYETTSVRLGLISRQSVQEVIDGTAGHLSVLRADHLGGYEQQIGNYFHC